MNVTNSVIDYTPFFNQQYVIHLKLAKHLISEIKIGINCNT